MTKQMICRIEPLESRRLMTYTLTNLSPIQSYGGAGQENGVENAPDITNAGAVSGPAAVSIYLHGKVRVVRSGVVKLIDAGNIASRTNTYPRGINEKNQTVGSFIDSKGNPHAYISTLGKSDKVAISKLPDVKGQTGANAYAINAGGLVAGSVGPLTQGEQAVVWTKASDGTYKVTTLPRIGITNVTGFYASSIALDVSDAGAVLGMAVDKSLRQRAVIWKKGSKGYAATDLGALSGGLGYSFAYSINELGQAVGTSSASDFRPHPVLFSLNSKKKYVVTDLGLPAGADSAEAVDINEKGVIVGYASFAGDKHAMLWAKNSKGKYTATDLNVQLPSGSQWTLEQATSINDTNAIVGAGEHNGDATWMLTFSGKGYAIRLAAQTSSLPASPAPVSAPIPTAKPAFSTQKISDLVLL